MSLLDVGRYRGTTDLKAGVNSHAGGVFEAVKVLSEKDRSVGILQEADQEPVGPVRPAGDTQQKVGTS